MVDSTAQCEEPFEGVGDIRLNLFWRHAVIEGGNQHDGNVNRRKHVNRHLDDAGYAKYADKQAEDNDEIRMSQRKRWHKKALLRLQSMGEGHSITRMLHTLITLVSIAVPGLHHHLLLAAEKATEEATTVVCAPWDSIQMAKCRGRTVPRRVGRQRMEREPRSLSMLPSRTRREILCETNAVQRNHSHSPSQPALVERLFRKQFRFQLNWRLVLRCNRI